MFRNQDDNCIVPSRSQVPLSAKFSSPVPWRGNKKDLPVEAVKCDPHVVGKHSWVPLFKERSPPPPRFATPKSLSPPATLCCRVVSATTAPQHPETWGTKGGSHPVGLFLQLPTLHHDRCQRPCVLFCVAFIYPGVQDIHQEIRWNDNKIEKHPLA